MLKLSKQCSSQFDILYTGNSRSEIRNATSELPSDRVGKIEQKQRIYNHLNLAEATSIFHKYVVCILLKSYPCMRRLQLVLALYLALLAAPQRIFMVTWGNHVGLLIKSYYYNTLLLRDKKAYLVLEPPCPPTLA